MRIRGVDNLFETILVKDRRVGIPIITSGLDKVPPFGTLF